MLHMIWMPPATAKCLLTNYTVENPQLSNTTRWHENQGVKFLTSSPWVSLLPYSWLTYLLLITITATLLLLLLLYHYSNSNCSNSLKMKCWDRINFVNCVCLKISFLLLSGKITFPCGVGSNCSFGVRVKHSGKKDWIATVRACVLSGLCNNALCY